MLAEVCRRKTTPAIVRATAVNLLGQYPTETAVTIEQLAIADSNPMVRLAGVRALGGTSVQQILTELGKCLSDPIRAVRLAAVRQVVAASHGNPDRLDPAYRDAYEKALAEYRESQALDLERAHPHINLGWLERQLGNTTQAADELRRAIRMEPYLTGPRTELANMLASSKGDADEIRKLREEEATLLERDASLLPENGDIAYRLGLLRYLLGEYEKAAAALAAACDLAPNNYEFRMALALLDERQYEQSGGEAKYQAAKDSLNQLRQMRPNDPRAAAILKRLEATREAKGGHATAPQQGAAP